MEPGIEATACAYELLYASTSLIQLAQLSVGRRDRATIGVIEYFAKSLKIIRTDNVE